MGCAVPDCRRGRITAVCVAMRKSGFGEGKVAVSGVRAPGVLPESASAESSPQGRREREAGGWRLDVMVGAAGLLASPSEGRRRAGGVRSAGGTNRYREWAGALGSARRHLRL